MANLYGSDEGIKQLLRAKDTATFTNDETARLVELRKFASLHIEHATGATFQTPAPAASAREVESEFGEKLFLPMGVRTVSSILEHPDWVSGAWSGGMTLTTSDYRLTSRVSNGAYRTLTRVDGGWSGLYLVTAVWEDTYDTIPDDITYIANFLAAEVYKAQKATPHGLIGMEGDLVPIRKAMQLDEVKQVIDFYTVGPMMAVI